MLVDLSQDQISKIQIDEGIVVINFGKEDEVILGPTRGGAEFNANPVLRDIDFDGRRGKTKGLQVKDEEDVSLKIITLCCSQENLALAIPNSNVSNTEGKEITQGDFGLIKSEKYLKNIAVVTRMLDGTYKILTVKNPMHEGAFSFKTKAKAENEHNLEFFGHYDPTNSSEKMWSIKDSTTNPLAT